MTITEAAAEMLVYLSQVEAERDAFQELFHGALALAHDLDKQNRLLRYRLQDLHRTHPPSRPEAA